MGHPSLRECMKGTWREESFTGDPKRNVKAMQMCTCYHRVPCFWGTQRGALFLGYLRGKKKFLFRGILVRVSSDFEKKTL